MEENANAKKLPPTSVRKSYAKTVTRKNNPPLIFWAILLFNLGMMLAAQEAQSGSLFPPNHPGYFVGQLFWRVGSPIRINLDSKVNLSLKSIRTAQRQTSRELSAEAELSPLNALPAARTNSDFQLESGLQRQFQGSILGLVQEIRPDGNLRVLARRQLNLTGALEILEIEGIVAPSLVRGNEIHLQDMAQLQLRLHLPAQGRVMENQAQEMTLQLYWSQFWDSLSSQ